MARPVKKKEIETPLRPVFYVPSGSTRNDAPVVEVVAEDFEALRLVDGHGYTLEEAARRMECSRSTAGRMLERVRRILARAIERHLPICIDAGAKSNFSISNKAAETGLIEPAVGCLAVAVDIEHRNAPVAGVFGRAPAFAIYAEGELDPVFSPNPGLTAKRRAADEATKALRSNRVARIVAGRFGADALKHLSDARIEPVVVQGFSLKQVEELYLKL